MHRKRVMVAALFLPLLYVLIRYLPPQFFAFLVFVGIWLGQYEFYRLRYPEKMWGLILLGWLLSTVIGAHFYLDGAFDARAVITALIAAVFLIQLGIKKNLESSLTDTAVGLMGVVYLGWFLGYLILLRNFEHGGDVVLFLFLIIWAGDAGAYYTGKAFGRRPLASQISPNKTVEGALGGLATSLAAAWLGQVWFLPGLSLIDVFVLGIILACLGQLGDLVESMYKRSVGVKDSGVLLSAHGGILDKVDSLIFTAPALYYYLVYVKQIGRIITI